MTGIFGRRARLRAGIALVALVPACGLDIEPEQVFSRELEEVSIETHEYALGWLEVRDEGGEVRRLHLSDGHLVQETAGRLLPVHPRTVEVASLASLWEDSTSTEWFILLRNDPVATEAESGSLAGPALRAIR